MCMHKVTDRWVMFVAGKSPFAATSTSVRRPTQPPVYWITKDISLWIKVSEVWNLFPVQQRGNVKCVILLLLVLHIFVRLGLDTGAAVSASIDNSTSSHLLLKWRHITFYQHDRRIPRSWTIHRPDFDNFNQFSCAILLSKKFLQIR
jgi:hypothetical protein